MSDRQCDPDVTRLLQQWQAGDAQAMERLLPLVYDELRGVARARLRNERADHTLQPTALVHEAYVRLVGQRQSPPQNRVHLFAIAARLMREILVDHARRKAADKRGGTAAMLTLDDAIPAPQAATVDLLALDEALTELHTFDSRLSRVVEMKFFAGLNINEMAEAVGVSTATIERDWTVAKAWLHQRLSS
jgi:RNA polymerase sigma factor (TIGR02999 family)